MLFWKADIKPIPSEKKNKKMRLIEKIDKNFLIESKIDKSGLKLFDVREAPFSIHGVFYEGDRFRRMPESVARSVSENVYLLHANTAGGRVRFTTDSSRIVVIAKLDNVCRMSHFALTGSVGLDLYAKNEGDVERYIGSYRPPYDIEDYYEGVVRLEGREMREITINLPLYTDVCDMVIGIEEDAKLLPASNYSVDKPIVYYGSSITQGGCASRPGNSYQAIVTRLLNVDHINLGFSGSAAAEDEMVDYLAGLDMSMFVLDYDYTYSTEHLRETHENTFKRIRSAHPNLPIILLPRPKLRLTLDERVRFDIIKATYENARAGGDENVYFIDGKELIKLAGFDGTVDGTHPNDLGFNSMAQALAAFISEKKLFN